MVLQALSSTPTRNRLSTDNLAAMTKINIHLRAQLEANARPRRTHQPGCVVPDTGTGTSRNNGASSVEHDDDDDFIDEGGMATLEVGAAEQEDGCRNLEKICTELAATVMEEEEHMAGRAGAASAE